MCFPDLKTHIDDIDQIVFDNGDFGDMGDNDVDDDNDDDNDAINLGEV